MNQPNLAVGCLESCQFGHLLLLEHTARCAANGLVDLHSTTTWRHYYMADCSHVCIPTLDDLHSTTTCIMLSRTCIIS